MIMDINLLHGDCLELMKEIPNASVDLILTDLPYGIMKNAPSTWDADKMKWDTVIDPTEVHNLANRILRKNGKMVLFSQEPYTSRLINGAIPNVPFSYRMIWEKDMFANALGCNKAPVSYYEDILVFSKTHDLEGLHPLRQYFKAVMAYIGLNLKQINQALGHRRAEHTFYVASTQFSLCTEETYNELIQVFGIDKMDDFISYEELMDVERKFSSVFNLWEGNKYKSNILKYTKDYNGYHPTQKPIALLEDLIKTFSNEGDTVVDLTMGSGSTGVACQNTNRNFTGIELDDKYFEIAKRRISEARNKPEQITTG